MRHRAPILEIRNLKIGFLKATGGRAEIVPVVEDLGLTLGEGSFTALVGESGSGKTVTALSICRLIRADRLSGQIFFYPDLGVVREMMRVSEEELRDIRGGQISYVFQDPGSSLNPLLRVGEQLDEVSLFHGKKSSAEAPDWSKRILERVKIKDPERVYKSFPHELSGGMRQRVMIAMALLSGAKLLVADEPTTALDVMTEAEVMDLLLGLQRTERLTLFFITHDLALAAAYADTIVVLQKGRLVEEMVRGADGFKPTERYTQRLFNARLDPLKPKSLIEV